MVCRLASPCGRGLMLESFTQVTQVFLLFTFYFFLLLSCFIYDFIINILDYEFEKCPSFRTESERRRDTGVRATVSRQVRALAVQPATSGHRTSVTRQHVGRPRAAPTPTTVTGQYRYRRRNRGDGGRRNRAGTGTGCRDDRRWQRRRRRRGNDEM